jgi:CRP-like cAMP-binding protein
MDDKETLRNILETLDDVRAILLLTNNASIEEAKKKLLEKGSEQEKIYGLCDGKTTEEIAATLQKTPEYVNSNLSRLRRKGLIKTAERNAKKVHEQRF